MINSTEGIEQRLRDEADHFLGEPPARDLLCTLRSRQQSRQFKRIAALAAGLLLLGTAFVGYRFSQRGPIADRSPQSPAQVSAADSGQGSMVAERQSAPPPDPATTSDDDLPTAVEAVNYDALSPAEQFAVRRFLETETGLRSTEIQEISL